MYPLRPLAYGLIIAAITFGEARGAEPQVIVYGTAGCDFCKTARAYLNARGISYVYKDVERDPEALREFRGHNAYSLPLVVIRDQRVHGYVPGEISRLYEELQKK